MPRPILAWGWSLNDGYNRPLLSLKFSSGLEATSILAAVSSEAADQDQIDKSSATRLSQVCDQGLHACQSIRHKWPVLARGAATEPLLLLFTNGTGGLGMDNCISLKMQPCCGSLGNQSKSLRSIQRKENDQ